MFEGMPLVDIGLLASVVGLKDPETRYSLSTAYLFIVGNVTSPRFDSSGLMAGLALLFGCRDSPSLPCTVRSW